MQLERDAPYVQIIEHYRRQIAADKLKDGDILPSGREIASEFGVSIATAVKVATGLQALGLVTPRPGAGTMVTAPRPPADRAQGGPIVITLAARGPMRAGTESRILEAGIIQAPPGVASQLGASPVDQVIRRRQATTKDGVTAALLTSWFPVALADTCPALLETGLPDDEIPGYSPPGGRTGCQPGRRPRPRPASSESSAAHPS
jgi:GntR family transcriptional regulator